MALMRRGAWNAAWRVADAMLAARGAPDWTEPRHLQAIWDGSRVAGQRVLVRCYHGLGDTLQFIRYLPLLSDVACSVAVWAQPVLIPLLATMRRDARWLPLDVEYDVDVEVMELPHLFRSTPETLPRDVPYLHPPRLPRIARAGRIAVGIAWQSGDWDRRRSLPFASLRAALGQPNVDLSVLQRGDARHDAAGSGLHDIGSDDPPQAASAMTALDLIVSVDSFPAHLAGALGLPVWLLLPHQADWRWMEGHGDSPWYPSMRLFRQPREGAWDGALTELSAALRRRSASR